MDISGGFDNLIFHLLGFPGNHGFEQFFLAGKIIIQGTLAHFRCMGNFLHSGFPEALLAKDNACAVNDFFPYFIPGFFHFFWNHEQVSKLQKIRDIQGE